MKKLVVFDWNGTLLSDTVASWKASNVCLAYYGAPPITLERYRETFHFPIIHFYKLNGCSVDEVLARKEEAYTAYQTAYEKFSANARTRRGAREVLQWLQDNNVASIILSNYLTPKIEAELKRLRIAHFFRDVSAHEDGLHILENTSKMQRLAAWMEAHGFAAEDTIIIGDSTEEPDIASHLGITSVGITEGYISEKRLRAAKPDYSIGSLKELIPLVLRKIVHAKTPGSAKNAKDNI